MVTKELDTLRKKKLKEIGEICERLDVCFEGVILAQIKLKSMFREKVLEAQLGDAEIEKVRKKVHSRVETPFQVLTDGLVVKDKQVYVPNNEVLKDEVF